MGVAASEEDKSLGMEGCLQVCIMTLLPVCEHQRRSAADRSHYSQQVPSPPSICLNICRSHKAWKQLRMRLWRGFRLAGDKSVVFSDVNQHTGIPRIRVRILRCTL